MATARNIAANCRKVVCIGRNYADHIKELSNAAPKKPFFFTKPPSSILPAALPQSSTPSSSYSPTPAAVLRPKGVILHYEVELALIMSRTLSDLDPEDTRGALDAIAGYAVAIDMTARNVQDEAKRKGLPWTMAKGFDTFLPISDFVDKGRIPDPHDVELWLNVNGKPRQQDSTGLMLFRIPRLLSEIGRVMTLEKGDVVCTGTPKGVGEVRAGDKMTGGLRVGGKDVLEASIAASVQDAQGRYIFEET